MVELAHAGPKDPSINGPAHPTEQAAAAQRLARSQAIGGEAAAAARPPPAAALAWRRRARLATPPATPLWAGRSTAEAAAPRAPLRPMTRSRLPAGGASARDDTSDDSWSVVSAAEESWADVSEWTALSSLNPHALPFTPRTSAAPSVCGDDAATQAEEGRTACTVCCDWIGPDDPAVAMAHCAHIFHGRCLRAWFATGNASCPNCRCPSEQIVERLPLREDTLARLQGGEQYLGELAAFDVQSEASESLSVTTARGWPRLADNTRPELLSSEQWVQRAALAPRPPPDDGAPIRLAASYRDVALLARELPPPPPPCGEEARGRPPPLLVPAVPRGEARGQPGVQVVHGRLLLAKRERRVRRTRLQSRPALATIVDEGGECDRGSESGSDEGV
ncbi:hypothetical protein AB1Y20_009151 [Prymnesium parvum]|uniref:RING-type domain-containing protein n=1 Tax=Prymnesium parvum TaxID=97485 RepID=A0AB34K0K2_PRYPA